MPIVPILRLLYLDFERSISGASLVAIFSPTTLASALGSMQFQFPAAAIVIALVCGPAIALLTSLSPARRAARMNIVDSLRFE